MTETAQYEDWPLASGKRLLLAGYVDYLIFGAPWAVSVWLLARLLPGFDGESWIVKIGFFAALELLLFRVVKWSPGMFLLRIVREPTEAPSFAPIGPSPVYLVDPFALFTERWWTLLVGVLIVRDGAGTMVEWTQSGLPQPWFGSILPLTTAAVVSVLFGLAEFWVGAGALLLRRRILAAGIVLWSVELASIVLSWSLLPAWVVERVEARRSAQGLVPRAGEVELMQTAMPLVMVAWMVLCLVTVALVYRHARRSRRL